MQKKSPASFAVTVLKKLQIPSHNRSGIWINWWMNWQKAGRWKKYCGLFNKLISIHQFSPKLLSKLKYNDQQFKQYKSQGCQLTVKQT